MTIVFMIIGALAIISMGIGLIRDNTPLTIISIVIAISMAMAIGISEGINHRNELCNEAYAVKNLSPESYECYILEDENRERIVELRNKHKEKDRKVRVAE